MTADDHTGAMPAETDKAISRTLDRGLAVLECVLDGTSRLDEITEKVGLSRSAAHRLLHTLTQRGYLQWSAGDGWRPGFRVVELGFQAHGLIDPAGLLQEAIDELAERVEDTVHLGVVRDRELLYVAKGQGRRTIQMISRVGLRIPAQNTAMGRVLLASGDLDAAVASFDPSLLQTERSIRTAEEFRAVLDAVRAQGFAIDDEESNIGLTCVAVPLAAGRRTADAALSVSAPSQYMTSDRVAELIGMLRAAAPGDRKSTRLNSSHWE